MLTTILAASVMAQPSIIDEQEYKAHGFERHLALGAESPFLSVGAFRKGCTGGGVWIGGPYVLTTAHSVVDRSAVGYYNPGGYEWVLTSPKGREHVFKVTDFLVPKAYFLSVGQEKFWGRWGADIALAKLDRIPSVSGVKPAVLADEVPKAKDVLTLVSYGIRGTTSEGTRSEFGNGFSEKPPRRFGFRVAVRKVGTADHHIELLFRRKSDVELQGITSSCDSGGGAFALMDGAWKLVGTIATSQMPSLEGPMKAEEIKMGVTALKPFTASIRKGIEDAKWSYFRDHNPDVK